MANHECEVSELNNFSARINDGFFLANEIFIYFYVNKRFLLFDRRHGKYLLHFPLIFFYVTIGFIVSFFLAIYVFLFFRNAPFSKDLDSLYVFRNFSAYKKVKFLFSDKVHVVNDSLNVFSNEGFTSLYSQNFLFRLVNVFVLPVIFLVNYGKIIKHVFKFYGLSEIGSVLFFYILRLPHILLYFRSLRFFLKNNSGIKKIYSSNKECRFGALDIEVTREFSLECICVPHGIEYSFRLPLGLPGTVFYCYSLQCAQLFRKIYKDNSSNFIFDKTLVDKILLNSASNDTQHKVVFFTEPRRLDVNIKIIKELYLSGIKFGVRLHPQDSEKNYNSLDFKVLFVQKYFVSNTICIARKSTILLEAACNGSLAIAVLADDDDRKCFNILPSLNSNVVSKIYSYRDLISFLKET